MTVDQVLLELRGRGVQIWMEGERLRYRAAPNVITGELLDRLREHKPAIIELLQHAKGPARQQPTLRAVCRTNGSPLSFAQERLWFLDQLEPNRAVYNIPMALRLGGALDVPSLLKALNYIVQRHEALRTRFEAVEGRSVQVIEPSALLEMPLVDLGSLPQQQREAEAIRMCGAEAQRPFDLKRDLMLRARLLRLGPADHILCLNMHHIASDGWSVGVLFAELRALYTAFVEGKPSPLAELPIQYADYAVWQREWLHGEVLEKQLSYWRKQLERAQTLVNLPADRPRPAVQSYRGALLRGELPEALTAALKELSRAQGVTLFMTLLAAFQTLLHRYTGGSEILVGSPIAGRQHTELEPLIGFFVNTLVFRGDLSDDPSFRTLLGRTRDVALGAYAHQDLPFEKLVEELHPQRDMSHAPIFQVLFALQNAPVEAAALPGLEVTPVALDSGVSKFDLSLMVREGQGALRTVVEYSTDLFDAPTIVRMTGHYQTLLEGIVSNPDQRLSDLPLLSENERRQILVDWNRTEVANLEDRCLHELIEDQVKRTPDAVAVVFESTHLTYRQLNDRANELAHHLQRLGVGPNTLVAIFMERSLDMVVGLLGILKAGGAYVPLDPEYPEQRLAFVVEDARPLVLLTLEAMRPRLPRHQAQVVCLDALPAREMPAKGLRSVVDKPQASDLAYVLYTSGSTGTPKGVQISHRAFVNFLDSMRREPGMDAQDTLLAVTTLSFDIAGLELFLPLTTGARVVIASDEMAWDAAQLLSLMKRCAVTVMQATPATWRMLLAAGWQGSPGLKILCGGEAWSTDLANELLPRCESLWNMYGPTETTVWSSVARVEEGKPVLIGPPIANTTFYILDSHRQPAPVGIPGELHIGGVGLARAYHNRAELTAEKFIADPFSVEPGARLYRTGDLARYLPDGNIEFLGRLDHQVKIRGFRIELGEIESLLTQHPGVQTSAVVVARQDTAGDHRLAAYIVSRNGALPASDLREYLRSKVPEYMVPAAFVAMKELPLTPNGKVDRKALPAPDAAEPGNDRGYVAPRTPTEEALAAIWRDLLGLKQVGIRDNFFDLGGHSLMTIRLHARIETSFGMRVPLAGIFQQPTVEKMAETLCGKSSGGQQEPGVAVQLPKLSPPASELQGGGRSHAIELRESSAHLGVANLEPKTIGAETDPGSLRQFFAVSDHWAAKAARRGRRFFRRFGIPAPRIIVRPILWVYLSIRTIYYFLVRVFICEPFFKAYCERYGRNVHTGPHLHWVQGKGAIILGDNVTMDGKSTFTFAARFAKRPTLTVGNNSGVGHGCRFTVAKSITIGSHCRIAGGTQMFDSSGHPNDARARSLGEAASERTVLPIVIRDHVWIGSNAVIVPGVTIGEGAIVAVGSVVMHDVAPHTVVAGNPASKIGETHVNSLSHHKV